jgi:hypothetical protein
MAEKELNLFQFPAIDIAEFCAGAPEIVWSEMVQRHPISTPSNDNIEMKKASPFKDRHMLSTKWRPFRFS